MKILLLAGSLFTGWFATNESVQDFATEAWNGMRGYSQQEVLTEEQQELHDYVEELLVDYTEEGLTEEEVAAQRSELLELIEVKATELGITLEEGCDFEAMLDRIISRPEFTAEMLELKEYRDSLMAEYDFAAMEAEERQAVREEIRSLIEAKALELGIELPERAARQEAKENFESRQAGEFEGRENGARGGFKGSNANPDEDCTETDAESTSL